MKIVSKKYFPSAQHVTNSLVKYCKALAHQQCIKLNTMVYVWIFYRLLSLAASPYQWLLEPHAPERQNRLVPCTAGDFL